MAEPPLLLPHRRIHLIGVGGAGMSALARVLGGAGHTITGSDLHPSPALDALSDLGLEVWSGHDPDRIGAVDLVVASSAIPDSDPEWETAGRERIPCWHRPQLLEAITAAIPTIGATGTHGKSSSTAMMVTAIQAAGGSPSFVVGADLLDLRTNAAFGADPLLVLEVDEAFGTFEHLHLHGLMVTNIEADHLDHFGSLDAIESAFTRVARKVDGPVVVCRDDPGGARLAARVSSATYGLDPASTFVVDDLTLGPEGAGFRLVGPDTDVRVEIKRPGVHMARNAAGVVALTSMLGYDPQAIAEGLSGFHGVRRRFEHRGTVGQVTVIDDYAHHPTEVAATLRAAREIGPRRLWAVFQPHLYSRTERLAGEFGAALALADRAIVCDVYGSRESPIPGVTGELVAAAAVRAGGRDVEYVAHRSDVARRLAGLVEPGDLVVFMGAGDITTAAGELVTLLGAKS
jgi:UDP-N-acetylmuramate--alanine ligase